MPVTDSSLGRRTRIVDALVRSAPQAIERGILIRNAPLFQQIVESSASCVMVVNATAEDQPILYASPALERLLGYEASELVGADWGLFLITRDSGSAPQALRAALRRGSTAHEILGARHSDGTSLYVDVRFAPLSDETGLETLQVAFLNDVTTECCRRETLEYRACYDPLTGLANRYLLQDRFERAAFQAQRHGSRFTLVLLDLDGFKQINDVHGHAAGDQVLRAVAVRLTGLVRGEDTVARWGGDEFVLILTETEGPETARTALDRIQESLITSCGSCTEGIAARYSFGAANYPEDGATLEMLLEAADRRLYAGKGMSGR
jgi:diguanylate cyclase (GGDEF)-like protein/PAS domain S-box-containing protein